MKLYHATERKNIRSILKYGLVPEGAFVSLSENPDSWYREGMALFEVDLEGLVLEMHTFLPELDEITVWGWIGPERLKLVR